MANQETERDSQLKHPKMRETATALKLYLSQYSFSGTKTDKILTSN